MALQAAIRSESRPAIRALLSTWAESLDTVDDQKMTALSCAAEAGFTDIVLQLLERGAKPDADTLVGGCGPLVAAVANGHLEVVSHLLARQVNPDLPADKTPLAYAAEAGHYEIVQMLVQFGAQVSPTTASTPLSLAAQNGHIEVVKFLVDNDTSPNPLNIQEDRTPLALAAENGHTEVVRFLARSCTDINSNIGPTPLYLAAENGHTGVVQFLVENGAILDSPSHESKATPLFVATKNGHWEVVRFLIQHGADPNTKGESDQTPLQIAAKCGHAETVKSLIQNGANPDTIFAKGRMYSSLAASFGYNEFAQLLLDKGRGFTLGESVDTAEPSILSKRRAIADLMPTSENLSHMSNPSSWLLWAAHYNDCDLMRSLGNFGSLDVEICNANGRTPLSFASAWSRYYDYYETDRIVSFLLDHGADVNSCCLKGDDEGRTPLSFAADIFDGRIARILLQYGADQSIRSTGKNWKGHIPLSIAAACGHSNVVEILLSATYPEPNFQDEVGRTPLWWAASYGHADTVGMLLQHGVLTDILDRDGLSALLVAAGNGHYHVVRQLIEKADLSVKDNEGRTALWLAVSNGHNGVIQILIKKDDATMHFLVQADDLETAEVLLRAGYDVEKVNGEGLTPLRLALRLRKPDFAKLLMRFSSPSRGIQAMEWLQTFSGDCLGTLQLSVLQDGTGQMNHLQNGCMLDEPNIRTSVLLYQDEVSWTRAPFQIPSSPSTPKPYEIQIITVPFGAQGSETWISLEIPSSESHDTYSFGFPGMAKLLIGCRQRSPAKRGETLQPTLCLSSLSYVWPPEDAIDIFTQVIQSLKDRWTEICNLVGERFVKSRLDQLEAEGRTLDMMRRLAKDAQRLTSLRQDFRSQIQTCRGYVISNGANSRYRESALMLLSEFESSINTRLSELDSTLKELLQIEFSWAAITESRISTSLGQNVMLLTYVSIFYLPLAFCAALWAIPNLADRATLNSFVVTSVVVGLVTLLVAFNLENLASIFRGKYSKWRAKTVKDMHNDERWRSEADELQSSLQTRSPPSEWLLVIFWLSRLMQKLKWQRGTRQGQPRPPNV